MSTIRKKFRVSWDDGEPIDITTNARDMANAQEFAEGDPVKGVFALIHSALEREGYGPPELEKFIDVLDEMSDLSGDSDVLPSPT